MTNHCSPDTVARDEEFFAKHHMTPYEVVALMMHWQARALKAEAIGVAQTMPNRMDKGRAFYLAMYEKDGAIWAANDHKGLWCDMAEDYERRLTSVSSTPQRLPTDWEQDKAETSPLPRVAPVSSKQGNTP